MQWFAQIVERAAGHTGSIVEQSQQIIEQWTEATSTLRHDSNARALGCLPGHPVINSADVADLLGVNERTGRTALELLAERGVLQPIQADTGHVGRARRWYAAADLLRLWAA